MKTRRENWIDLKKKTACDVLILGGGINGSGLLRELALQGLNCVLVDKGDFAAGASSASSRMIHGGLRYLENAEFKLVAEAVTERNRLLRYAPHFVRPLKTTIPIKSWFAGLIKSPMVFFGLPVTPGGRGAIIVKMGLLFYDFITGKNRQTPRHFFTSKAESLREIPGLRDDISCTATYWDAWISQTERLCVDMICDACRTNNDCLALNYVTARKQGDHQIALRDSQTGEETLITPALVVNATGAWVDAANKTLDFDSHFMGGTKGSHLVVNNKDLYNALGDRMVYYEHADGRICITFRFMDKVIVGSTDIRVDDPDTATCEEKEIEYMLTTLQGVFPHLAISRKDIVFKFCGVRPLPSSGLTYTSRVPRSHHINVAQPAPGRAFTVYSLIGGKLTTFRALAEQAADLILTQLARPRKVSTAELPYPGAQGFPMTDQDRKAWCTRVAAAGSVSEKQAAMLLSRYGVEAENFIKQDQSAWSKPLKNVPHYCLGEIRHITRNESICHLADLVRRRSIITILGEANDAALAELADITGEMLGWDAATRKKEIELAQSEIARCK